MKRQLLALTLSLLTASVTMASFPVKNSTKEVTVVVTEKSDVAPAATVEKNTTENVKSVKKEAKTQAKATKKALKAEAKTNGDDTMIAIILALVSVLFLPLGLHNWYLGRKKQALWQLLLVVPGFILLLPPLISWIWQIVDLIRLLINGSLPS